MLLRRTTSSSPVTPRALALALLATVLTALPVAGSVGATAAPGDEPGDLPGVAATPSGTDSAWEVEPAGEGTWRVRWTSPDRLPVGGDRPTIAPAVSTAGTGMPRTGEELIPDVLPGVPTVAEDGRTVEATVVSEEAPDPDDLDVVLSGRVLDEPGDGRADDGARTARWTPPARELLGVDPATPGTLATRSDEYTLPGIRLPGMPQRVEMTGYVVEPVQRDAGRPLVVFLHGRHSWCYDPVKGELGWDWPCARRQRPVPSHRGYGYLQQLLASQGYVTVSISANGINAQDGELPDAGAAARSRLVRAHLDRWAGWVAGGTRVADLRDVVLVGHSRGGEGVARASLDIPLRAAYRISGQVLLAPTDFSRQSTPYVPSVTLLPYCDGDVVDLQGQAFTDVSRDIAADDTSLKSSVLVMGANHNFFNTEWTPGTAAAPAGDDAWLGGRCDRGSAERLTAVEQQRVGAAYVAGAVHLFTSADERVRPMYDGSAVRVASTGDAVVLSHALGGRELRRPGAEVLPSAGGGAVVRTCYGFTAGSTAGRNCGRYAQTPIAAPHWPSTDPPSPSARAFELTWSAPGQRGTLGFHRTPLDLTGAASLDLRTVVEPRLGDVALTIRVRDADGRRAEVRRTVSALPPAPEMFRGRYWAQILRVDTAALTQAGVDVSRVVAVDLLGRSSDGRVWVLDVAARPTTPPVVPERRAPVVDLGEVSVLEGDRSRAVALVPYKVRGTVTTRAAFRVHGIDLTTGKRRTLDVRLAPGATGGTLRWEYAGNRLDSLLRKLHVLSAYGTANVMAADYQGRVLVRDDDPAPRVGFRAVAASVPEGRRAVWRYTLSQRVDYPLVVALAPVRGPGTPLRVNDLDPAWARQWVWTRWGTNPFLHQADVGYFEVIRPGRTSITLSVPTRRDRLHEGRETVTVRARTIEPTRQSPAATVTVTGG